jgi:hypothetical protein
MAAPDTEEEDFEHVNCTFAFFDPELGDAQGIAQYLPKFLPCDRASLAMVIARQPRVGSTIKNETVDEEVGQSLFGFVSCLNLGYYSDVPCIKSIVSWLMSLGNPSLCELLTNSLRSVGFLLSERAYGVPPDLAPHLCRSIFSEIEWATEDLESSEEREAFRFSHYVMAKKAIRSNDGLEFPLVEDELFFNHAELKIEFSTNGEEGDLVEQEYHRFVLVLSADSVALVRREVNGLFGVDERDYAHEAEPA